jgi:low affinity Fe/Cu permease
MTIWDIFYVGIAAIVAILQVHYRFVLNALQDKDNKNNAATLKVDKKLDEFIKDDREDYATLKALKERVRSLELEIETRQEIAHDIRQSGRTGKETVE